MTTDAPVDAYQTIVKLLSLRAKGAIICPSEVARTLASQRPTGNTELDWRMLMPLVHAAVDQLLAGDMIGLTWKGRRLASRDGPYRIGPGQL